MKRLDLIRIKGMIETHKDFYCKAWIADSQYDRELELSTVHAKLPRREDEEPED